MAERTITTDDVRRAYRSPVDAALDGPEFDRWLAEHDRAVGAEALREAADAMDADPEFRDPLRLKAAWVRERADRIEAEGDN